MVNYVVLYNNGVQKYITVTCDIKNNKFVVVSNNRQRYLNFQTLFGVLNNTEVTPKGYRVYTLQVFTGKDLE